MNSKKQEIIKAAAELFEQKGYHATSINEICEKAQVSKGGLFYHFSSKEDILFLIHEEFINYVLENAEHAFKLYDDPVLIMKKIIIDLVICVGTYRSYVAAFFQERKFLSQNNFKEIKYKRDTYESIVVSTLKRGVEANKFRDDLNVQVIAKAVFGMCDWLYQWYKPEGSLTPEDIGEMFWKLFCEGYQKQV